MEVDAPVDAPVDDEVEMEVEPIDKEVGGPIEGFWSYAALGAYLLKLSQLTDEEVKAKLRNVTVMVLVRQYCTAYESQLLTQQNRDDTFDEAYERVKSLLPKSAASVVNAFATRAASVAVDQINGVTSSAAWGVLGSFVMSVSGVRPTRLQTPQVGDLIDGFKVIETDGRLQLVDSSTKLLRAEWGVTPAQDARLRDLKNNQAHWRASFMPGKPENFQIVEEEIARLEEELEPKKQWITPVKLVHTLLSPIQKDVLDRKNIHVIDFDDITGSVRVESGEEGKVWVALDSVPADWRRAMNEFVQYRRKTFTQLYDILQRNDGRATEGTPNTYEWEFPRGSTATYLLKYGGPVESMRGEGPWNQSFGVDICLMPDESMPAPPPGGPRKGQKRSREQQTPVAYWSNTQGWVKWPQAGDKVEFPRTSNREYTIAEDGPSNYILTADAKQVASWNTDYPYGWDPVEGLIGNFRRMSIRDANWIEKFTETRGLELHKSSNAISLELKSYVECRSTNMSNPVNTEDSISAAQMAKYARHHVQYAFLLNEYDRSDDTDRTPTAAESLPDYKALTEWEKAPASFIFRKAAMPPQYKRYQITWTCSAASARPLPLLDDVVPIISVHSDEVGAKVFQSSQTVKDALLGAIMQHVSTQNRNNKFTSEMYTIRRVGGGPYQAHIEVTLTLPPGAEAEAWWKGRTSVDEPVNQTYLRSYSAPGDMEKLCDFGIAEFANGLLNNSPINPVIFLTWGESNNTWGSTPPKSYGILAPLALETAKLVRAYDTTIVNLMQDLCGIIDKSNVTFEALGNYISQKRLGNTAGDYAEMIVAIYGDPRYTVSALGSGERTVLQGEDVTLMASVMLADQTRLKVSGDVHVYEVLRGHRADLPKRPKRAEELPESHIVAQSADSTSYKQYCEVMDSFDSHDSYNILQHVSVEDFAAREAHWRSDFGLERMLLDMVKTADSSDTALKIIAACTAFVTDWHNTAKFFPTTRDDVQVGDIYGIDPVLQPSPSNVRIVDDYTIDGTQLLHKQTVVAKWDVNSYSWNNLRPGNTTIQKLLQKRYEISDVCMLLGFWHRAQKGIVTNLRRLVVANCSNKLYSVINSCFPFESEEVKGLVDQGIKHRIANLDEGRFLDDFEAMAGQMLPADLCVPSSQTELRTVKELNAILLILEEIAEMDHAELSALCGENTPAKVAFKRQCETLAEHVRGMSYLVGANHQVVSMRPSTLHRHGASPLHQETASDSEDEVSDGVFDVNLMDVIDALVDNDEMFNQADESVQDSAAAVAKKTPVEGAERASFWSTYSERKMTRGTPISTGVLTDYIVQVKLTFNSECMSFHPAETVSVCIKVARADQYLRMLLQTKPAVALCALLTEDGSPVFVLDNSDTSREMTDVEKSELYAALLFSSGIAHEDCRMIKALPC